MSTSESQPEANSEADAASIGGSASAAIVGPPVREQHSQLYLDALEKISVIFGKHLKDVLERHRRVETLTGERNVIGRQNLVEALAHRSKKLLGHITPDEVQQRFDALTEDIVHARRAKIADGDWSAWTDAADDLENAAKKMKALKREMGAAVDAAQERRFHRKLMLIGVALSVALGAAITIVIQAIT